MRQSPSNSIKSRIGSILTIAAISIIGILSCIIYMQQKSFAKDQASWEQAAVIIISKQDLTLKVVDFKGKELLNVPVATGQAPGNKKKRGDMRTPEGIFKVLDIQDASAWKHDFGDGLGEIEGCYGSHFIRLEIPGHSGIGIHGTHLPESIGTRSSEGCIRLNNDDLLKLVPLVTVPMTVIITPAAEDVKANVTKQL